MTHTNDGDWHSRPDNENNHIFIEDTCWCNPDVEYIDGERYILHKNKYGYTILTDPMLKN